MLVITIGLLLFSAPRSTNSQASIDGVSAAWQRATEAGSYRFHEAADRRLTGVSAPFYLPSRARVNLVIEVVLTP
jgi:hypothetical protein